MNNAHLPKILIPVLTLSLSACSSSSPPATSGASGDNVSHTVIIGQEVPGGPSLKGTGRWSAIHRDVDQFHAIDLKDCVKVRVAVGQPLAISVEADENLVSAVNTKVESGRLVISLTKSFQTARAPEVIISVPELSEVNSSGSGEIQVTGVKGDVFKVDCSGSGTFYATGKVTTEKLTLSGAGKVDCVKLVADNVTVELSGAGDCFLDAEKALNAKLTGAGSIKYKGNPAVLTKSDTGAGSITALTL